MKLPKYSLNLSSPKLKTTAELMMSSKLVIFL